MAPVLRDLQASLLVDAGEAISTVSARLGHRDTSTTLRIYSHLMPGADARAADIVGKAFARPAGVAVAPLLTVVAPGPLRERCRRSHPARGGLDHRAMCGARSGRALHGSGNTTGSAASSLTETTPGSRTFKCEPSMAYASCRW